MTRIVAVSNFVKWFTNEYLNSFSQQELFDALRLHWNNYHLDTFEIAELIKTHQAFDTNQIGDRSFISQETIKTKAGSVGIIRTRPDKMPTESTRIQEIDMHGLKFKFQWFEQYGIMSFNNIYISRTLQPVYNATRGNFQQRSVLILPEDLVKSFMLKTPKRTGILGGGTAYQGFCQECAIPEALSDPQFDVKKAFLVTGFVF